MRLRLLSQAVLLMLFAVCQLAFAQKQSVTALPFATYIAPSSTDGLDIPKQRLELTEQGGWLVAALSGESDELEWKIVLAKIIPDSMPKVSVHPQLHFLEIQYGPWFIRESHGRLRVYREMKDSGVDTWNQIGEPLAVDVPCAVGRLFIVKKDDWYWVCTSPKHDRSNIDTLIRFQHEKLKVNEGLGAMGIIDDEFAEVFCGESRCHDEGDLLIAERITDYMARAMISSIQNKRSIVGSQMPAIGGKAIGDIPMPSLANLKGKVILIDFWATWCGPCVKKLPAVNALHERFEDRGLIVVGVHANQDSEKLPEFMAEHDFNFPVVLGDGETESRFAISQFPSFFLVGRDGKIIFEHLTDPPTDAQIEAELAKEEEQ